MASSGQGTASRPGGRSARVVAAVHQAVAELISERGPDQVSIPAVAARAGVNATSIYRRWGDVRQLLVSVAESRLTPDTLPPNTGSLRQDLVEWADDLLEHISAPEGVVSLRTVVNFGADDDVRQRCLRKRADQVELILERARARGGVVPSPDQVMDHVLAPLYFRVMFAVEATDSSYAHALVDELLSGNGRK
ncbi:TetR/AcrR family transcriptional regulator [Streptomyces sp. NPDC005181]|uniref:TetR/AcrR family transcriptional regulator n=1 Tax=Streptomyces sp. NPDC005181 TaxID=3156869 RepID=UPI0033AAF26B